MVYLPKSMPPVQRLEDLRKYVEDELAQISKEMGEMVALELRPVYALPQEPRAGMIAYADGTEWDPGSGEGPYYYTTGGFWNPMF